MVERPLEPFEQSVLDTIREQAAAALEQGRAQLEVEAAGDWTNFELRPANSGACQLTVSVNREEHLPLPLALGRYQVVHEIEAPDGEKAAVEELRRLVGAVVNGRYDEEWRQVRRGRRSVAQFVGTIHAEGGPIRFSYDGGEAYRPQKRRRYSPY